MGFNGDAQPSKMLALLAVDCVVVSNCFLSQVNSCSCESNEEDGLASSGNGQLAESSDIFRCCDAINDGMCCGNAMRL